MSCSTNDEPDTYAKTVANDRLDAIAKPMNSRMPSSPRSVRRVWRRPRMSRRSGGSVSGSCVATASHTHAPMTASATKIPRHDPSSSSCAPSTGARIGATPMMSISEENTRTAEAPECRSRTTACATTMPAAPPKPCTKRSAVSVRTSGATAHSSDATT
jgi:hypothetical protein